MATTLRELSEQVKEVRDAIEGDEGLRVRLRLLEEGVKGLLEEVKGLRQDLSEERAPAPVPAPEPKPKAEAAPESPTGRWWLPSAETTVKLGQHAGLLIAWASITYAAVRSGSVQGSTEGATEGAKAAIEQAVEQGEAVPVAAPVTRVVPVPVPVPVPVLPPTPVPVPDDLMDLP